MSKNDSNTDYSKEVALFLAMVFSCYSVYRSIEWLLGFYVRHRILFDLECTLLILAVVTLIQKRLAKNFLKAEKTKTAEITKASATEPSVFAGRDKEGSRVFIRQSSRRMHTQVVGTTNAGKTESVILPWAINDIEEGRGCLIVDGKSDSDLLDKLYAYAKRYHRTHDVRIISLSDVGISHTFNPLSSGSPLEVAERFFVAFDFENEYYKDIQFDVLLHSLLIFERAKVTPTFAKILQSIELPRQLHHLAITGKNQQLISWAANFMGLAKEDREKRTSGLIAKMRHFTVGETAKIFNSERSDIELNQMLSKGHIVYCQLPAMQLKLLGHSTGKLILQALQSAISKRHTRRDIKREFFSVYLDDFTEYLTENFVTLLNKSRSANVAIVFAHQAVGDLETLGPAVKNSILTNSNLKVLMRTNEPESAEYFAKVIGTKEGEKVTERQVKDMFGGSSTTGEGSVRATQEFEKHPNLFKQKLGVGEAVVVIPHQNGSHAIEMKFEMRPNIDAVSIPRIAKEAPKLLPPIPEKPKPDTKPHVTEVRKKSSPKEAS